MKNYIKQGEQNFSFTIKNAILTKAPDGNYQLNITFSKKILKEFLKKNFENTNLITYNQRNLTKRELQVLEGMYKGKTNSQIARELIVTVHTIKAHVARILKKLSVENRQQAILLAEKEKIVIH